MRAKSCGLLVVLFVGLCHPLCGQESPEAKALFEKADRAWKENRLADAEKGFEELFEKFPDHVEGHEVYQHFRIHQLGDNDWTELLNEYRERWDAKPSADAAYLLARITLDLETQEELLREGLKREGNHTRLFEYLAICYAKQGKWKQARQCGLRALALEPDSRNGNIAYWQALDRLGLIDEGDLYFLGRAEESPEAANRQILAFHYLVSQDRWDEVAIYLDRATSLAPEDPRTLEAGAIADMTANDWVNAKTKIDHLKKIDPWGDVLEWEATLHLLKGRTNNAISQFHLIGRLRPLSPNAWLSLCKVYGITDQPGNAEIYGRRALLLNPDSADVLHALGLALKLLGKFDMAVACLRKSVDIEPEEALAWRNLSNVYRELGLHEEAVSALERADALSEAKGANDMTHVVGRKRGRLEVSAGKQNHSKTLQGLAQLLARAGEFEEAKAKFEKAIELHPGNAAAYSDLAMLEEHAFANREGAAKIWQALQAIDEAPPYRRAEALRQEALVHARLEKPKEAADCFRRLLENHRDQLLFPDEIEATLERLEEPFERKRIDGIRMTACTKADYCMPQSLATVLSFWDIDHDVEAIGAATTDSADGALAHVATRYLDSLDADLEMIWFTPTVENLELLLRRDYPVVLLGRWLRSQESFEYEGHASVAVGFDEALAHIELEDSNWFQGLRALPYERIPDLRALLLTPEKLPTEVLERLSDQEYHQMINRAILFFQQEKYSESLELARKAVALSDAPFWGHLVQAEASFRLEDEFGAELAWQKAGERAAVIAEPYLHLARLYSREENVHEMARWLTKVVEKDPTPFQARLWLAKCLMKIGPKSNYERAAEHARHLVQVDPGSAEAFAILGRACVELERPEEARDAYVQLVSLRGTFDDVSALAKTQAALSVLNDSDEEAAAARQTLEAARELAPALEDFARLETTVHQFLDLK